MLNHFPKIFAKRAVAVYFVLLVVISLVFSSHILKFQWMLFGAVEVGFFFYYASNLPMQWSKSRPDTFRKRLFITAFLVRSVYVVFSYIHYKQMTGVPFEYSAADSLAYDSMALWIRDVWSSGDFSSYWTWVRTGLSDSGYASYLAILYILTGNSLIIVRLVKALISAYTCVLIYKFSRRHFDENVARLASIFCLIMPNLIFYCGLNLKEVEMTFLLILFVERLDCAICQRKIQWDAFVVALLSASLLFTFRTVIGAVALLSAGATLLFTSSKIIPIGRKILIGVVVVAGIVGTIGDRLYRESMQVWNDRNTNQEKSMNWRSTRAGGNSFAKYASASVFAPLIFTIPFPTMVETPGQENQKMIHGGNFVKNVTSGFTIFALVALFISGDWRKHILPISVVCGYLIVLAFSGFAQSERFHYPSLPLELLLAAYGISLLKAKHVKWFNVWLVVIFVANVAWAWFKLKGRGLV